MKGGGSGYEKEGEWGKENEKRKRKRERWEGIEVWSLQLLDCDCAYA